MAPHWVWCCERERNTLSPLSPPQGSWARLHHHILWQGVPQANVFSGQGMTTDPAPPSGGDPCKNMSSPQLKLGWKGGPASDCPEKQAPDCSPASFNRRHQGVSPPYLAPPTSFSSQPPPGSQLLSSAVKHRQPKCRKQAPPTPYRRHAPCIGNCGLRHELINIRVPRAWAGTSAATGMRMRTRDNLVHLNLLLIRVWAWLGATV